MRQGIVAVLALVAASAIAGDRDLGRATVEVNEEVRPDRVRLTYTVRHLAFVEQPVVVPRIADTDPAGAVSALTPSFPPEGVVQVVIGAAIRGGAPSLRSMPIKIDSPAGWHPQMAQEGDGAERRWRLSWTCADAGWSNTVTHRIKAGDKLGGFVVELPRPDPSYADADYQLSIERYGAVVGKVFPSKRR
jgi:hypothetical protein